MGNVVGYLVLVALSTAAALLMDGPIGSTPLYLLVFLLFASLAYTLLAQWKFSCRPVAGRRVFPRGETSEAAARMHNAGWLPLLHMRARVWTGQREYKLDFSLAPHESKDLSVPVCPPHVGPYEVGIRRVRVFDPIGLFSFTRCTETERITVAPRVAELVLPPGLSEAWNEAAALAAPDRAARPEGYDGVREYREGDSLRHIHWKLTAHTARYMSRRYESHGREGVTVYLDRVRPQRAEEDCRKVYDCVTETALSFAAAALRRRMEAEIVSAGPEGFARRAVRKRDDLQVLAAGLGARVFGGRAGMAEILENDRKSREGNAALLVCAARVDSGLIRSLAALAENGRRPALIYAVPAAGSLSETEERMLGYLTARGIPWRAVDSADRLQEDSTAAESVR